jgi:hypothetical protein
MRGGFAKAEGVKLAARKCGSRFLDLDVLVGCDARKMLPRFRGWPQDIESHFVCVGAQADILLDWIAAE